MMKGEIMYNLNYLDNDWYRNMQNNMNKVSLFSPMEGFEKGNLFANLYNQYKNYKPAKLRGSNEKEKMFLELLSICFAAHELNLYLDLHPEDTSMLSLFNDYRMKENELKRKYESKYGPLTVNSDSVINNNSFMWVNDSWPWEDDISV